VKEFVVYTVLRVLLFAATFGIVIGIWAAVGNGRDVNWLYALIIAFLVSGVASYTLLNGQRARFAAHVEDRASKAAQRFEALKGTEDDQA
jgi:mannitol-specific phosphotransferase system IIBC component